MIAAVLLALLQAGPDPAIAALLDAGKAALRAGRPADALGPFGEAVRRRPNAPDAHFYLGQTLHRLGRNAEAVGALRRAEELQPGNEQIEWALGLAASARGEHALAAQAFSKVAARDPRRADALFNLGVVQRRAGISPEGTATLLRAWALDPSFPNLAAVLAEALVEDGEFERAEEVAAKGISRAPRDGTLLLLLGRARAGRGDFPGAVEALDRAIAAGNDSTAALEERSLARARAGDLPGAEADGRAALARDRFSGRMLYHLATVLQREGKREEARALFDRYREEGPILDDLRGKLERASRRPLDPEVHGHLAYLYVRLDDLPRAAAAMRRGLEVAPALAGDRTAQGILLLGEGRWAEAKAQFEAVAAERPGFPDVHLYLQRCCERLGEAEAAAAHRERFAASTASTKR
ncbi:MAG: tetratricopeptide repeat protein [Planctomycetes bacterium]|nr:tetratricopeptide repeat protein [Planctomycetota bacterium]